MDDTDIEVSDVWEGEKDAQNQPQTSPYKLNGTALAPQRGLLMEW